MLWLQKCNWKLIKLPTTTKNIGTPIGTDPSVGKFVRSLSGVLRILQVPPRSQKSLLGRKTALLHFYKYKQKSEELCG